MKPGAFDFLAAKTIAEAQAALAVEGPSTMLIAGGQSLLPMLSLRVAAPDFLIDIGGLEDLKESGKSATAIRLGALTTHADAEDGQIPDTFNGLLPKVASRISYRAVRNYGTIGGSVALADPAADWPVCLMALGAEVLVVTRDGVRSQAIGDLIRGQYTTSLLKDEIIVGFDIPAPDPRLRWGHFKVVRKSGAYANSIAIAVQRGGDGPVLVALGAAAARPFLLPTVAAQLQGGASSDDMLRTAITQDLASQVPDADPYLMRLHTSTVLRAVQEMRSR
ncbi:MAG TPA: FAD binding domain-containing protein [Xanthobacteraceae bacterium]|jgi:carbon-monoxide dehydrogenase medium subunit